MGLKTVGKTGLNVLGTILGSWGPFYDELTDASLSSEERASLVKQYNESLGLTDVLLSLDGFDKYMESRIVDVNSFPSITGPTATNISEADQASRISDCFAITDATKAARINFTEDMANIQAYVQQKESNYHPRDLTDYLSTIKGSAYTAIKNQHNEEVSKLTDLFNNSDFKDSLKANLSLSSDDQVNKIKKDMMGALDKSHKEELTQFEKSMDEPLKKLHTAAQIERDRVSFLAMLYKNDSDARKTIEALSQRNQQEGAPVVDIEQSGGVNKALFKGIKVTDLPVIRTITGKKVTNNGDGSFSMSLPNHLFTLSPGYYLDSRHNRKRDLMSIPLAIKACGYSSITMTVSHSKNEEDAMETARDAYAACIEAGFKDDNVHLVVNGKKVSNAELFATCPSRRQAAQVVGADNEKKWKENEPSSTTRDFKDRVEAFRSVQSTTAKPDGSPPSLK